MTDQIAFPPLHDLSPGELEMRKQHLLSEIAREASEGKRAVPMPRFRGRRLPQFWVARPILIAPIVLLAALAFVPIGGASLGTRAVDGISSLWDSPPNQPALDAAASDAESVAGSAYYTDAVVDDAANTVDVYLASAPQSIIDQLQSLHPGTYVIHNDAAHPLSELRKLRDSLPLAALSAQGIDVVSAGPTPDGYLKVGVSSATDVQAAQSAFDSADGVGVVKVYGGAKPGGAAPNAGQANQSQRPSRTEHHDRRSHKH